MDNQVIRVIDALCDNVSTPRALAVKLLVHAGEWAQLQELRCRVSDYSDSESYWKDVLVTDILRKCDLETTIDREQVAVDTFWACETQCATTNVRLARYMPSDPLLEDAMDLAVFDFISRVRKEVSFVLGNLPDHLIPRFSGGATFADTGKLTTIPDKMSSTPTIYAEARCLLPFWQETAWFRALSTDHFRAHASDPRTVRGNKFFTVPKDGTKFRGCCKEASIPVSLQLDCGRVMKNRLSTIGIDLRQDQPYHKALARVASVRGHLATIDMSNASDTVCRVLPKLLLRGDWWELLNSLRATHTQIEGKWVRLEKFSSMGNGFTFELETLIFACLARTVIRDEGGDPDLVNCYGDDLIVPTEHFKTVMSVLRWFGFTPNPKKTFGEGPFRESCGGDYWSGMAVRPHHIERLPDEPQQWISLANGLRRVALANPHSNHRWLLVRDAWFRALDPIPSHIRRCRGPEHLGDIVIHDEPERWGYTKKRPKDHDPSWSEVYITAYVPVPEILPWNHWIPAVQLASCTLGLDPVGVTPRGGISGFTIQAVGATLTASWTPRPPSQTVAKGIKSQNQPYNSWRLQTA
uniref:RNA-directed RNA polymerase n=1 Tax=Leviviridae sp. TaxID=2027243 RepID=A0A514D385_9VIRU|nr:MAG: RNA-dependent RNA polymerase [Leviviridae sp.]